MRLTRLRTCVLSFLTVASIVATACGGSPTSPAPTPTPTPTPAASPTAPADCAYTVGDAPAGEVAAAGGQFDVTVTTALGCAWSASSSAQFIATVGATSGSGPGSMRFAVAANTGASRQGNVQVANRTLSITQATSESVCEFTVDPTQASVEAAGGTLSVTVTRMVGTCGWTATSNDGFITIESGSSGTANGT